MNFIFLENEVCTSQPKTVSYRPYTQKNISKLKNILLEQNFSDLFSKTNADEAYEILSSTVMKRIDDCMPVKTVRFNKYKHKKEPWVTKEILSNIKQRDQLYKKNP